MWWFLAVFVVALVVGYAIAPRPGGSATSTISKPGDLETPTARVGIPIPVLFGTRDIKAPNVLWYGDTKVKKAILAPYPYQYYAGMHLGLCLGPIDKIVSVEVGEKILTGFTQFGTEEPLAELVDGDDAQFNNPNLFGGVNQEGGMIGKLRIRFGDAAQPIDSYLLNRVDTIQPAYRGVATVVVQQSYLGTTPYLKPWAFRASRIHIRQSGALEQWYDEKAEIGRTSAEFTDVWKYRTEPSTSVEDFSGVDYDDSSWDEGPGPFGNQQVGSPGNYVTDEPGTVLYGGVRPIPDPGSIIWLRRNLGVVNAKQLIVDIQNDDGFTVYMNGEEVTDGLIISESYFRNTMIIPAQYLNPSGDNIFALRVQDSEPEGNPSFIFAGARIRQADNLNPAHIIRECLTDPDWGMGFPEADIDDTAFEAAADTLFSEEFGMSVLWDRTTTIEDFVQEILRHIDGTLYVSRDTGKFVLKLIREDYDIGSLIVLNESNIDRIENFTRSAFGELANSVTVKFWNAGTGRDDSVSVQDTALVQQQGGVIDTEVEYPGLTNTRDASKAAARDLRAISTSALSVTIYTNQDAADLNIGDVFKFTWDDYGISETIMRVTGVAYGDGRRNRIRITCIEDSFSTPDGIYVEAPSSGWLPPRETPIASDNTLSAEMPWHVWAKLDSPSTVNGVLSVDNSVGNLFAAAVRPVGGISSEMWTDLGPGFVNSGGVLDFCGGGDLTTSMTVKDLTLEYEDHTDMEDVVAGMWLQVDGEIMEVISHNLVSQELTVNRGVMDTVPAEHTASTKFIVWGEQFARDDKQHYNSDVIDVKLLTSAPGGVLSLAQVSPIEVTMGQRAWRPYPPGNLEIETESYATSNYDGVLTIDWAHRSRTDQIPDLLVSHFDATDYGPEVGQVYRVLGYEDGVLQSTEDDISGKTTTWTPSRSCTARVEVSSKRDGVYSLQSASHEFIYGDVLITEDGNTLETEDNETRILTD